jgi:16S rRNA (guanine1207-N2)-methyltransferase
VWAVDVNQRAVALCAANAIANGCENVRALVVDEQGHTTTRSIDDVRFSGLWSNPPIRIGKAALHSMLTTWLDRLTPDGTAWLVVQRHLGADSLADWLTEQGWATTRFVSRAGYRLLEVKAR